MDLKACHASYLSVICENPGISQDKLAQRICINKSNVARQAAVLEEQGFITRTPSEQDKRVLQLHPTQKALALLPDIQKILNCWENCITADLTEEEKKLMSVLLAKMKIRAARWMEEH
jgi:DNA-binding MarR family transcriptional regulator